MIKKIALLSLIVFAIASGVFVYYRQSYHPKDSPEVPAPNPDVTIDLYSSSYKFEPDLIKVKQGQTVKFNVSNFGYHTFVIDKLNIKKVFAYENGSFTVKFDKPGTYTFYCDVEGHRQKGQYGTLMVE